MKKWVLIPINMEVIYAFRFELPPSPKKKDLHSENSRLPLTSKNPESMNSIRII